MKQLERLMEATILASRWILVVFYLGLAAALLVYALAFGKKLLKLMNDVLHLGEAESVLSMLAMIDAALVASLIVMVMISGYENFVSRFDDHKNELTWLGKIDAGFRLLRRLSRRPRPDRDGLGQQGALAGA